MGITLLQRLMSLDRSRTELPVPFFVSTPSMYKQHSSTLRTTAMHRPADAHQRIDNPSSHAHTQNGREPTCRRLSCGDAIPSRCHACGKPSTTHTRPNINEPTNKSMGSDGSVTIRGSHQSIFLYCLSFEQFVLGGNRIVQSANGFARRRRHPGLPRAGRSL